MRPAEFIALALVGGVGVLAVRSMYSKSGKVHRALRDAPLTAISAAQSGAFVKIAGSVQASQETLRAPISGRPCVYWEVNVRQNFGKRWHTIIEQCQGQDFFIKDHSGRAMVRFVNAQVAAVYDHRANTGFWQEPNPILEEFLSQRGQTSKGLLFTKQMEFREGVIEPGESVAVAGRATHDVDPEIQAHNDYRDAPKLLVLTATKEQSILVSDHPHV